MPTIRYDLVGSASTLISEIKSVASTLDGSLARAQDKANKRLTEFTGNAAKAGKAVGSSGLGKEMEGLKRTADGVGGKFGEMAGRLENLTQAFGILGPAGVAAGLAMAGAGIAVAGLAAVVVSTISDIDSLEKELAELGLQPGISHQQRKAIDDAKEAFELFEVAVKNAAIALAAEFAPEAEGAAEAMTALVEGAAGAIGTLGKVGRTTAWLATPFTALGKAMVSTSTSFWTTVGALEATESQVKKTKDAFDDLKDVSLDMVDINEVLAELEKKTTAGIKAREVAAKKAGAAAVAAAEAEKKAQLDRFMTGIDLQKENIAWIDREREARRDGFLEAIKQGEELQKQSDERVRSIEAGNQALADSMDWIKGKIQENAEAWRDAWLGAFNQIADSTAALAGHISGMRAQDAREAEAIAEKAAELDTDIADAAVQNAEQVAEMRKRQARAAFFVEKAAALASIAISTAQAAAAALVWAGVTAPLVIPTIVAAGATQAGLVASQRPPFHLGTDEVQATLRQGEAVLTPGGAASIGRDVVDQANRGALPQSDGRTEMGGQSIPWARFFDRMVAEALGGNGRAVEFLPSVSAQRSPYDG